MSCDQASEPNMDTIEELLETSGDPSNTKLVGIINKIISRKPTKSIPFEANFKCMIEIAARTLPTVSVNELIKKAKKPDPVALLGLGDCYFFGIKGAEKNLKKASVYYTESANMNNAEAATMMAYLHYSRMLKLTNLSDGHTLPIVQFPSDEYKLNRAQMWYWLEKCVSLGWISQFLIHQASDAQRRKEPLSIEMKRELIKSRVEVYKEMQAKEKRYKVLCENPSCSVKFNNESKLFQCSNCKSIKYCSRNCQIAHWPKHKSNCKQAKTCSPASNKDENTSVAPKETTAIINLKLSNKTQLSFQTSTLQTDLLKYLKNKFAPEEAESLILSKARLASVQNNTMPLDSIKEEIKRLINRKSYPSAIKFINLAIDKMHLEKPFYEMTKDNLIDLIELFLKRVECYMKIAESRRASRYNEMALDDCIFVLGTGVFEQMDCPAYKKLEDIKTKLESANHQHTRRPRRRPNRNRQTRLEEEVKSNDSDSGSFGKINVTTCSKLIDNKMALNSQIDLDYCPICSTEWSKFIEPSLVAILPCEHACCVKCMFNYNKACQKEITRVQNGEEDEDNVPSDSSCVLCRQDFSPMYLDEICSTVVKEKTVQTLFDKLKKLPLDKDEGEKLISCLMMSCEFDINKIENALFNMIGMVQADTGEDLDHKKKQEYFELARAPVKKLTNEYYKLVDELKSIYDTSSKEWESKFEQLENLRVKLDVARQNAANDIFERMNSTAKMGALLNDESITQIDLHGLYITEAIEKVNDLVLPMLGVLKKIMLITGYGLHNKSGDAILKNGLKDFFKSNNIKFNDVDKNEGAIYIYQN